MKRKKQNTEKRNKSGFTLVEALVSIAILLMAVVAPMKLAGDGIAAGIHAKNHLVATYLTQDVLEFVRYRFESENNMFQDDDTYVRLSNMSDCMQPNYCYIDTFRDQVLPCGGNICPNLRQDPVSKKFGYLGGYDETQFVRELMISSSTLANEFQIVATTTFSKGGDTTVIVVKDLLTGWREAF